MGKHDLEDGSPTQVQNKVRTVVRTLFQIVVGVAAFVVAVSAGLPVTGALGVLVTASTAITAFMARKDVNAAIDVYLPWLRAQ